MLPSFTLNLSRIRSEYNKQSQGFLDGSLTLSVREQVKLERLGEIELGLIKILTPKDEDKRDILAEAISNDLTLQDKFSERIAKAKKRYKVISIVDDAIKNSPELTRIFRKDKLHIEIERLLVFSRSIKPSGIAIDRIRDKLRADIEKQKVGLNISELSYLYQLRKLLDTIAQKSDVQAESAEQDLRNLIESLHRRLKESNRIARNQKVRHDRDISQKESDIQKLEDKISSIELNLKDKSKKLQTALDEARQEREKFDKEFKNSFALGQLLQFKEAEIKRIVSEQQAQISVIKESFRDPDVYIREMKAAFNINQISRKSSDVFHYDDNCIHTQSLLFEYIQTKGRGLPTKGAINIRDFHGQRPCDKCKPRSQSDR